MTPPQQREMYYYDETTRLLELPCIKT